MIHCKGQNMDRKKKERKKKAIQTVQIKWSHFQRKKLLSIWLMFVFLQELLRLIDLPRCACLCEGQRTTCRCQFSSSKPWVLGTELGSPGSAESVLWAESHQQPPCIAVFIWMCVKLIFVFVKLELTCNKLLIKLPRGLGNSRGQGTIYSLFQTFAYYLNIWGVCVQVCTCVHACMWKSEDNH